jgi:hypothetical protein
VKFYFFFAAFLAGFFAAPFAAFFLATSASPFQSPVWLSRRLLPGKERSRHHNRFLFRLTNRGKPCVSVRESVTDPRDENRVSCCASLVDSQSLTTQTVVIVRNRLTRASLFSTEFEHFDLTLIRPRGAREQRAASTPHALARLVASARAPSLASSSRAHARSNAIIARHFSDRSSQHCAPASCRPRPIDSHRAAVARVAIAARSRCRTTFAAHRASRAAWPPQRV